MSAVLFPLDDEARPLVVALHCSGGTAGQWKALRSLLEPGYRLVAPNLHGAPGGPVWKGERRFHLADEAAAMLPEIHTLRSRPVHLVGHSFGGALALHMASRHPDRVASLTLFEPTAFHLLKHFGDEGSEALREIIRVSTRMRRHFAAGAWRLAAAIFVDYWNRPGAWQAMRPELQDEMVRYLPKAQLDFHALMNEADPPDGYARLGFPVRLLRGEHAPYPTCIITDQLAAMLPDVDLVTIRGAGHMGPLTHPEPVAHAIAAHIRLSDLGMEAKAAA